MRIAHVLLGRCNPGSANGVDKSVYHLGRHQAAQGGEVAIFSLTAKEALPVPGAEVQRLPPPVGQLGRLWPRTSKQHLEALLAWKPNLVHFHSVHIGPFVALGRALEKRNVPYVVTPHGGFAPGRLAQISPPVKAYIRLLEKPYLQGARFIHAVSSNDLEGLRSLGIRTRIVVVPNGLDLDSVPTQANADLLRQRFPGLVGKRVFLFIGRLDPVHKGLDLLLKAFAAARLPEASLVLVGPDWRGSLARLQEQARRLGLGEQVVFAGPAYGEEKWAYLAGADVFVHPSRWEGFSLSVLEAMAVGKPVLLSRAADPGGIGVQCAGVAVEPKVDELSQALSALGRLPLEELERMGRRAKAIVAEQYNWQPIAARMMEAYQREGYGAH